MKLLDLDPKFAEIEGVIVRLCIDCPVCKGHKISIPVAKEESHCNDRHFWKMEGDKFENLTLTPSILHNTEYADWPKTEPRHCESHFFIKNGEIVMA